MRSIPEKDNIESKSMRVEAMTEKGEVSFAEECKRLLDLRDKLVPRVIRTMQNVMPKHA